MTASLNISVKWNGKKYPIEVDLLQSGIVFKMQLFSLTGVAPERQKIMVKGGMLKDDVILNTLGLKEGQQLMMMGTAGELPKAPEKTTVFVEDMSDTQLAQALKVPAGLINLGNTCYMNATIQCLRAVPELLEAMEHIERPANQDAYCDLSVSMRSLLKELNDSGESILPMVFLQVLRSVFPQFGESNNQGFLQQDAEECWGQIIQALNEKIPGISVTGQVEKGKRFVEQYMTTETISTTHCTESESEPKTTAVESFNKLRVNISAGVSTYLVSEIANSLIEKIEKNSPSLNRSAKYSKSSKITRLPQYLTVNFVRFQWKPQENVKAKILKRVQFPMELDMVPFCTPELQEKLAPAKQRLKEMSDKKADEAKLKKLAASQPGASTSADVEMVDSSKSTDYKKSHFEALKKLNVDDSLVNDPGTNPSGQYDLVAVLTHVGRAADSGHYIGWVKSQTTDNWWKFDDDRVSQVQPEDIVKLEGGGDWHTAYICLYRSKILE
ncbi:deubiquitinating enzyme [Batrachochytrium dendrobatidis]|nr:deubiquitinating enzyme [Batrachochytrium dendrobatidis]KAK5668642.1 deubiquitinating enzyme [Batrachochytrium dendrobatidis]